MKGVVSFINSKNGRVAALVDGHGFTVFELLGGYEIDIGDIDSGNLDDHGGEVLMNHTQQEEIDVYIQAISCGKDVALRLVRGRE